MKRQSSNKYNKTRTATGAKLPLYHYPITQFRFKTEKHPVITGSDRCSFSIEAKWSQQELLMIAGLTSALQCNERDAIRIALYEALKVSPKQLLAHLGAAKAGSAEKGHEGRKTSKRVRMTKNEKESFSLACKTCGIRETELIRLVVIRLARGIKDGSITRLTNSSQISQMELFREWSRTHKVTQSKLKALKAAASNAWLEAQDLAYEKWDNAQRQKKLRRTYRALHPGIENETLDALISIEEVDHLEEIVRQYVEAQQLSKMEEKIFRLMFEWDITEQEAAQVVKEQAKESAERLTEDEWCAIEVELATMFEEFRKVEFEIYLEEKHGVGMSALSTKQMEEERHLFLEEKERERQVQAESINRNMDAKLQRRIRRSSPEYRDNMRIRDLLDKNIQMP